MSRLLLLALLLLPACAPAGGDDDDDGSNDGSGTITFVVDGVSYTEATEVSASLQGAWMGIVWNSLAGGDLGEDFYGSLTLAAWTGAGSYAPVQRQTNVDAIVEIAATGGSITYYPVGASAPDGGGSVEVTSADANGAVGTFAFTGYDVALAEPNADITGTFDVTFGTSE